MALTTTIKARINAVYTLAADHGTPRADLELLHDIDMASGTGSSQADKVYSDQRTINASSNDDLDLAGSLTDILGQALTFAKVKAIFVKASAANSNNVVIGAAGSNIFTGPFADSTDKLVIPPGGHALICAPVSGWTVTAGSADTFRIANSGAGTSVTYDIIIIGTSA